MTRIQTSQTSIQTFQQRLLSAAVLLTFSNWAHAEPPVTTSVSQVPETASFSRKDPASKTSLGFNSVNYLSPIGGVGKSVFNTFEFETQRTHRGSAVDWSADLQLGLGIQCKDCNSVELPQAYIGTARALGPVQLKVGRVKETWSRLDEEWQLGIYEPRFIYDYLKPESVGLAGAFLSVDLPGFQLTAYGSPGFVPDRGLPVHVQNGEIASVNPFFRAPIRELVFENQPTPIRYELKSPPTSELLLQAGGGLKVRLGEEQGPWLSGAYAYKPINQILLAYNGVYNMSFEVADADLFPRVLHHHVGSAEVGYNGRRLSTWISALREVPVQDRPPSEWTYQTVLPATAVSPSIEYRFGDSTFESPRVQLSYLREWGGNGRDQGPLPAENGTAFERRYPYQSVVKLKASTSLPGALGSRFTLSSQAIYDLQNPGTILSGGLRYRPARRWTISMSADVLTSSSDQGDFIGQNRSNDRYQGGVSYEF